MALQLDDISHRQVITLDLALCHRMIRFATAMGYLLVLQIDLQIPGQLTGTVVSQYTRFVPEHNFVNAAELMSAEIRELRA